MKDDECPARAVPGERSRIHIERMFFEACDLQTLPAGFPGFEGSYASGDEGKALAMTGAGVATGAALASPAVVNALRTAAAAHPLASKIIMRGLEGLGLGAGLRTGAKWGGRLSDLLTGEK